MNRRSMRRQRALMGCAPAATSRNPEVEVAPEKRPSCWRRVLRWSDDHAGRFAGMVGLSGAAIAVSFIHDGDWFSRGLLVVALLSTVGLLGPPPAREIATIVAGATAAVSGAVVTLTLGYAPLPLGTRDNGILAFDCFAFLVSGVASVTGRCYEARNRRRHERDEEARRLHLLDLVEHQCAELSVLRSDIALLLVSQRPKAHPVFGRRRSSG